MARMSTNDSSMYIKTKLNAKKDPYIFKLPVLPETIKISSNANNASAQIVDIGEITQKQGRKAKVISFSSFFPLDEFSGSLSLKESHAPITFVNAIEKSIEQKLTVRFVFSRKGSNRLSISMLCTIEKFDYHEDGADPDTIHYSITLKEYRSPTVNQIKKKSDNKVKKVTSASRGKVATTAKTYTVKKNDTLYSIAKKYMGNGNRKSELYKLNKTVIEKAAKKHGKKSSSNGQFIYVGTVLTLPKK